MLFVLAFLLEFSNSPDVFVGVSIARRFPNNLVPSFHFKEKGPVATVISSLASPFITVALIYHPATAV